MNSVLTNDRQKCNVQDDITCLNSPTGSSVCLISTEMFHKRAINLHVTTENVLHDTQRTLTEEHFVVASDVDRRAPLHYNPIAVFRVILKRIDESLGRQPADAHVMNCGEQREPSQHTAHTTASQRQTAWPSGAVVSTSDSVMIMYSNRLAIHHHHHSNRGSQRS